METIGSAMIAGKLHPDVKFVDSEDKAVITVVYDSSNFDKKTGTRLYFYNGYLVATSK